MARRLDVERGEAADPTPLAQPVGRDDTLRSGFAVSATGILAHRVLSYGRRQLAWIDRAGRQVGTVGGPDENAPLNPSLSPDGRRVAVQRVVQGKFDIW